MHLTPQTLKSVYAAGFSCLSVDMSSFFPAPVNGVYPCNDAVKNPATMASSVIRTSQSNTVYQYKQAYDAANPGSPFKFASAVDRMAYILGKGNTAPQGGGCGYTPPN